MSEQFKVTVDLNATRVKLAEVYNEITSLLNQNTDNSGMITLTTDQLQGVVQDLRRNTAVVCHTYIPDSVVYSNIGDKVPAFVDFNPNNY